MFDTFFLIYVGFFTLVPAIFFFVKYLIQMSYGLYVGLSQIITYRQLMLAVANVEGSVKKHIAEFHFPDSWHLHH